MEQRAVPSSSFTYDVFLNFRGTDTRTSFIEFLYDSLDQRGIYTFIHDERLERGEEITAVHLTAIWESRIAIVVFSKNYASSTYCLKELVQIMECIKGEGRLVLPIFYKVDPSDVRHQINSYGEEFAKLEDKFQDNKEEVQKWRNALYDAANLSGFHYKNGSRLKFIKRIVEKMSKKISHIPLHVADHPVGLESQLVEVTSLLELGNDKVVNMVGIWGTGGIGKTTIAYALYNSIVDQFESACLLANIREKSTMDDGLVKLQKTLLSELLDEDNVKFSNVNKGISILRRTLCRKKVLLILDDIDELKQLRAIAGGQDWFGFGSRVIITTRDKHWLATHGVVQLYEVKELNSRKALELFSWHAFKNSEVDPNYIDLSNRALRYTSGLPMALEVIGSYLFGKNRDEWNSALDKFERSPNQKLYKILKVSYDSLDGDVKEIFLDIACFYNGHEIKYVKEMLYARNFLLEDGIRMLVDKSLVKLDASNRVLMPDLIQDMGREIVRQKSISEPGKRSRLWFDEDIVHVLEENTGTDNIEVVEQRAVPSSPFTYHVFLNFRGTDTRIRFIDILYHFLDQRGIYTFIDDKGLKKGEEITPALLKAIQESRIAIVVFSKKYASSTYCLKELVQIMECIKGEGRLVLPIFYKVDPSDVRHQRNSYGEEFAKLEDKFQDNKEEVQKWRNALYDAANLSGFHYKNGYFIELIESIVEKVSKEISHTPLRVVNHPVGLDSQVQKVTSLLELNDEGVNMVGIWGIGGIGKTAIAQSLYNSIANQFERSCFLANVREKSTKDDGLVKLQKELLSKLLDENNGKFNDVNEGISILKMRLCRKKVLLILDDVNKLEQLKAIVGELDWFGLGSRVIITTRDKHLLATHGVVKLYEVQELNMIQALELFSWNAFKNNEVDPNYADLSNRALHYAQGLPMALKVLGSHLFGKSRDEWNSALDKYERSPNNELYEILKVSYDSLDEDVKGIFLDIACFFNRHERKYVEEMLHIRNFHPEVGIRELMDKSLVKFDAFNRVLMNDLIQDMGREIVRQESISEPGKRSRLWFDEDIVHVLKENTGTDNIEVIVLNLRKDKEVQWSGKAFKKMKRLRVLIIVNARFSTSPEHLPNSLRVLHWSGYPSSSLPCDFHPEKLVRLNLAESCLEDFEPLKMFESLSIMEFKDCKLLTKVPDLSGVPSILFLVLDNCTNLTEVHHSVGFLDKLVYLSAKGCTQLLTLVPSIKLTSLETLDLSDCLHLESFPEVLERMDNIRDVYLDRTAISELPLSVRNLTGLKRLFLRECERLHQLPYSIKTLPELEVIMAFGCKVLRLYEEHGDPEYVTSDMMLFDVSECCIKRFVGHRQCFLKACTVIISDNFIRVHKPSKLPTWISIPKLVNNSCSSPFFNDYSRESSLPLDHYGTESSLSLWFRNQFPKITLIVVGGPDISVGHSVLEFNLCLLINGAKQFITSCNYMFFESEMSWHTFTCDLVCEAEKLFLEHEWNHVEVSCELKYHRPYNYKSATGGNHMGMVAGTIKCIAFYVCKEKSSMEDVQFTLPNSGIEAGRRGEMTLTDRGIETRRREEMAAHHASLQSILPEEEKSNPDKMKWLKLLLRLMKQLKLLLLTNQQPKLPMWLEFPPKRMQRLKPPRWQFMKASEDEDAEWNEEEMVFSLLRWIKDFEMPRNFDVFQANDGDYTSDGEMLI